MKTTTRKVLLATAAVALLGVGAAPKQAMAFDEVNWNWESTITENLNEEIAVNIDVAPSGLTQIEKMQLNIGDVTATSTVSNVINTPPGEEGPAEGPTPGPTTVTLDLKALYDDNVANNPITSVELLNNEENDFDLSNATGYVDNNAEELYLTFDLTMPEEEPNPGPVPIGERLGVDLPAVASVATAVANNQSIETSVSTRLHDGQFAFGGFAGGEGEGGAIEDLAANFPDTGNTHTDIAAAMALGAASGAITPATISADSSVTEILNASVDSQATAVANNMSVDLAGATEGDAFMIADITQVAYADVSATSLVDAVTIEGYSDLGSAGFGAGEDQIPLVNSVATAVGNNLTIKVNSPGVGTPEL